MNCRRKLTPQLRSYRSTKHSSKKCEFYIEDLKRFDPGFAEIAKHLEQVATTYEAVSSGEDYHSEDDYLSDTKQGEVDQNEFAILTKKHQKIHSL